jgi:hypothetical protein
MLDLSDGIIPTMWARMDWCDEARSGALWTSLEQNAQKGVFSESLGCDAFTPSLVASIRYGGTLMTPIRQPPSLGSMLTPRHLIFYTNQCWSMLSKTHGRLSHSLRCTFPRIPKRFQCDSPGMDAAEAISKTKSLTRTSDSAITFLCNLWRSRNFPVQ